MNDLLKSAIADAKAIKDTAMQNAKATLEESIFYKVSPLLESKDEEEEEKGNEEVDEAFSIKKKWMTSKTKSLTWKLNTLITKRTVEEAYGDEE
jgi:hypothetical protein